VTARLSDANLCAQVEADAMDHWAGAPTLDLVRRYREVLLRARLRAVVEGHRAPKYYAFHHIYETPRELLAYNRMWRAWR
jgi:hypothetical protein